MGLLKEITFNNGVNIKYHKIDKITMDKGQTKVSVACYTDETFRNKEKQNNINKLKYEQLINNIFQENQKEEIERNTESIILWSDEANTLINTFEEDLNLVVVTFDFVFENLLDLSLTNLYSLIKEDPLFANAQDL